MAKWIVKFPRERYKTRSILVQKTYSNGILSIDIGNFLYVPKMISIFKKISLNNIFIGAHFLLLTVL